MPDSGKLLIGEGAVVCFGELLVALAAPDCELLFQSPHLEVRFGGAEANVAAALAQLGQSARMVSFVPDNRLGQAAVEELRRRGVDASGVRKAPGRMGLYFLTTGAGLRASEIVYDRGGSAFAEAAPDGVDWGAELKGAGLLHLSGVTPALGAKAAAAAERAVEAARGAGVPISFDGNYRGKLWSTWNGDAPGILGRLIAGAGIAFVDDRDIGLILGRVFEGDDAVARRRAAAQTAFEVWPNLQLIASTVRTAHATEHHDLSAVMFRRGGGETRARTVALTRVVDRIGSGDAFAAGLIHGLRRGWTDAAALDFALAAACLKHTIPGDVLIADEGDVRRVFSGEGIDVRR